MEVDSVFEVAAELEPQSVPAKGGGGDAAFGVTPATPVAQDEAAPAVEDVSTTPTADLVPIQLPEQQPQPLLPSLEQRDEDAPPPRKFLAVAAAVDPKPEPKSIAKLVVSNPPLQKVVNPQLITVLNSTGPLTVVKSLCVTTVVSTAPHYTLVNSAPLNVTAAGGKAPTITVLNCGPLVKALTAQPPAPVVQNVPAVQTVQNVQNVIQSPVQVQQPQAVESVNVEITQNATIVPANAAPSIVENRGHNVFVKNTCPEPSVPDNVPQSHKLLTANNFPPTNVLTRPSRPTTANGQKNKVKVLSNIVMQGPTTSQTLNNMMVNKVNNPPPGQTRYLPRQKLIGANGAQPKYLNKPPPPPNNVLKSNLNAPLKPTQEKSPTRLVYPSQKGQVKTMPPGGYMQKPVQGIKTLTPQNKGIPGQVQRTGSGLRTIPPQRPQKIINKTNYIGKHAVQAQKVRATHGKMKGMKMGQGAPYGYAPPVQEKQMTFNQALTAQIIETLSNPTPPPNMGRYEILPARYDGAFSCPEVKAVEQLKQPPQEEKAKSGLDALSLICQAVLLDHNYNATMPSDSPTRPSPPLIAQAQINGMATHPLYSPGACKRRPPPPPVTCATAISSVGLVGPSLIPGNSAVRSTQEEDAASDISDGSERKHDTEGEETDTAPEAEAVNNDDQFDHYGDYITRCLCGFIHDDGYMVECDRCKVWQHVQCVVKNKQIPDEYLCEVCDPTKPVDRQKARVIQQQWLRERQLLENKLRKDNKGKEMIKHKEPPLPPPTTDSDSSDTEQNIVHNNNVIKGRSTLVNRRRSEGNQKSTKKEPKEPVQKRQKRKERKVVKRKVKTKAQMKQQQSHSDDENQDTWASHLPQLRQWIEKYEEAVTNHYSPELRARISSIRVNGVHSDNNVQFDPTVCKCRVHTEPLTEIKYLVCTAQLGPNTPIIELRGKYMLSMQHRNSGGSLTTRQHTQRPGPFLFFYRLHKDNTEVCVDTRTYGNSARFIRRSCKPNAELRHCIEKGVLHLYVVSIMTVEKNCELTIKHESHDLAAIGTTQIACACGNQSECTVNKTTIKKNGETPEVQRKRRGRRATSTSLPSPEICLKSPPIKEESPVVVPPPPPFPVIKQEKFDSEEEMKIDIKEEPLEIKEPLPEIKQEEIKQEPPEIKVEAKTPEIKEEIKKKEKIKEDSKSPNTTPIATRRSSHYKSDKEDSKDSPEPKDKEKNNKNNKKLSREERKLEAILRAIEQMEKADQRKQEHQAKQAHRRESEPGPNVKDDDKHEPKIKRRRRKGRSRTTSTNNQSRRGRLNSTDSYITSGDENMLSPNEGHTPHKPNYKEGESGDCGTAAGLLLSLSRERDKTPPREPDSNSNSAHSSPEMPVSSACLLVQAAVEPLEQGFKFPKTKKGLMNEWLNKGPEHVAQSQASPTSNDEAPQYYTPGKNLTALAQAATLCGSEHQPQGSAKKRWLRQAISEDHSGDSPGGRPDSPPINDSVAPPKKRRLPRESISNDNSPPLTPTGTTTPINLTKNECTQPEGCVEIVSGPTEADSPTHQSQLESEAVLKERAAKMKQEFIGERSVTPTLEMKRVVVDPRLAPRDGVQFPSSEHLVGTVEKTLSIFGFENDSAKQAAAAAAAKRKVKLSITEYRQRKKQSGTEKGGDEQDQEMETETASLEENNSSESFKLGGGARTRSSSTSSTTSLSSSDEDAAPPDVVVKAPAFNCEPTELERQREISSLRLKKAFGLAIDADKKKLPTLNVEAILRNDVELEPKVKPIPIPSPTFPIPGSSEIIRSISPSAAVVPPSPERTITAAVVPDVMNEKKPPHVVTPEEQLEKMETETEPAAVEKMEEGTETAEKKREVEEDPKDLFFASDGDRAAGLLAPLFEPAESVSYVPPFNNPVYPNTAYARYTSAMDDEGRYEGRNPSPPPDLADTA